jgi:hypothetical protein
MDSTRMKQVMNGRKELRQKFLAVFFGAVLCASWVSPQAKPDLQQEKTVPTTNVPAGSQAPVARQSVKSAHERDDIAPNTPVIKINGACEKASNGGGKQGCRTEVTRSEMDTVLNVLEPNASPAARRQLAINYARLLAAAGAAEKQHLDKDPAVVKELAVYQKLVRMQVLADHMYRHLETQASQAQPAALRNYFNAHTADFEEADLLRLSIPKSLVSPEGAAQELEVLKSRMEALRTRAAAGEDVDLLQQEVNRELGIKAESTSTVLKSARRTTLPAEERGVFDIQAGQVTSVIDLPNSFVFLKLVSKQLMPIASAKPEMILALEREQLKDEARKATENTKAEFNLRYFGLPANPELFPPPQVTGLLAEPSASSRSAQRTQPTRQSMATRRHEVTIHPAARP